MRKILDKVLISKINELEESDGESVVELIRKLQDASGIKVCMNVTEGDSAVIGG